MKKKYYYVMLLAGLLLGFTGCGEQKQPDPKAKKQIKSQHKQKMSTVKAVGDTYRKKRRHSENMYRYAERQSKYYGVEQYPYPRRYQLQVFVYKPVQYHACRKHMQDAEPYHVLFA